MILPEAIKWESKGYKITLEDVQAPHRIKMVEDAVNFYVDHARIPILTGENICLVTSIGELLYCLKWVWRIPTKPEHLEYPSTVMTYDEIVSRIPVENRLPYHGFLIKRGLLIPYLDSYYFQIYY